MRFRYFDHTADVMFEAYGETLEEAFSNAALAMFNILTDIDKVKPREEHDIEIHADSVRKLLFDFLDELIFLLDTEHLLVSGVKNMQIIEDEEFTLSCTVLGDKASLYPTHGDIKAPTYNEMHIVQGERCTLRIVVDI